MNKDVPDIVQVSHVVRKALHKMASEGKIEAAAVEVKNLAWVVDMQGRESWLLTLENVEPSTVTKLVPGLIHELEMVGLGWDDWDVYTEFPDEDGTRIPQP
tara:strand:+ start:16537 stop:16839 length:303 start_codon:yes stop_codon:yes gene_type:complete